MTFISYAQNFEDVMLWRALKHVKNGFYIDIGAAWPDEHSVTKAFYDHDWNGINVEPNPEFNRQLLERRPRDQNLRLAVGDREGSLTMNFLGDTGLSTLDDAIANQHQKAGWSLDRQEVQVTTLAILWDQYVPPGRDVHFLKVDVEGLEEAVLRGNDWTKGRPWVVVVEATLPMSQVESHETWEPILLAADYIFAFADGLNRFYVASERSELLPAFKYPPNVFDDFMLSSRQQAETQAQQSEARALQAETRAWQSDVQTRQSESRAQQSAEQAQQSQARAQQSAEQAQQSEARAQQSEARAGHAQAQVQQVQEALQAMLSSRSWRITAPLRWCGLRARLFRDRGLRAPTKGLVKKIVRPLIRRGIALVDAHPTLKNRAAVLAQRVGLHQFFRSAYWRLSGHGYAMRSSSSRADILNQPVELLQLTPRARKIHTQLKADSESKRNFR